MAFAQPSNSSTIPWILYLMNIDYSCLDYITDMSLVYNHCIFNLRITLYVQIRIIYSKYIRPQTATKLEAVISKWQHEGAISLDPMG